MLLHTKILGQGAPLLILHGYFGMGDNWKSMANKFAQNFEVHLIDQRNHGRSFHSDDFNYELLVEDLKHYLDYYKLNKIYLLGHSMGGKTAMHFAITYPKLVNKLIVADISPRYYSPHHHFILEALNAVNFDKVSTRREVAQILKNYIKEEGIRQFLLKNVYWKEKGKLAYRFNLESLTKNNQEVGKELTPLSVFEGATLFLKGENSSYITDYDTPLIEAHFPKAKIVIIKNAGHWLHAENPNDFYAEVLHFLLDS
jgi:pimeloyl-ACP methyl ester carboxylesterase